jgi:ABC-type branched-subunit amino acid transport system substrate-binding protein
MASYRLLFLLVVAALSAVPQTVLNIGIVMSEKTSTSVRDKLDNGLSGTAHMV